MHLHIHHLTVPASAIDINGHVNNVEYLRWMQDAAISHADATGGSAATAAANASWVVRSHHVEYLRPAYLGEKLAVITWVATRQKASSLRRYLIARESDLTLLARGETNWIFVNSQTGRPKSIPQDVAKKFLLLSPEETPEESTIIRERLAHRTEE